jgi:hypothetical protein
MTRTNPSKTKPRMEKTTDRKQADRKQIIFTEGAKGGGGKTTLLSSLADFSSLKVFRSNWSMRTLTIKAEEA